MQHHGLNPDGGGGPGDVNGTLELRLDPALGGTQGMGVELEFSAGGVRGSLSPEVSPMVLPELERWFL